MSKGPTELVIDRARWLRGVGNDSKLLNAAGCMCCLGFLALACGLSEGDIDGQPDPSATGSERWPEWIMTEDDYSVHSSITKSLMRDNDDKNITDGQRERLIAEHFASVGVTVRFVDGDPAVMEGSDRE